MEPLDEIIQQLDGMKLYGSSSSAAEAYVSLMKEINKIKQESTVFNQTRGKFYMTAGDALQTLYPYEYQAWKRASLNDSREEYNLLIELITMSEKRVIRPLPKISNVPKESVLRFSDFSKITSKINTMEITMDNFLDRKKKVLDFDVADEKGIDTYKSVLFVESTEEYKGHAIPFLYIKTYEDTSIFQSPYIFKDNTQRWEIHLKAKTK